MLIISQVRKLIAEIMLPFLVSLLIFTHFTLGESGSLEPLVPALYVFGDSLVDSGTNINADTPAKCNYRPYGIDFPASSPTGRFTNGKTIADLFCDYLGLPYAPPYNNRPVDWLTGYNYASGSCGILNETRVGNCHDLDLQVRNFLSTVETDLVLQFPDPEELSQYLSKSIFLIVIGSNDYIMNYFNDKSNASTTYTPEEFAELLINRLSQNLQMLYKLGARKAIVAEVGALGCLLYSRNPGETTCNENKNRIASIFNEKLSLMMQDFTSTFRDSHFSIAHIYELSYDAFINPTKYGLTNTEDACCPLIPIAGMCLPTFPGLPRPCQNRNEYYLWDAFHPSEAIYSIIATQCIHGSTTCLPLNLHQLVQVETNLLASFHSAA